MTNIILPDWLKTIVISFLSKTPVAFKIVQIVLGVMSFITGLPTLLISLGIKNLPPSIIDLENKAVMISGILVAILLQFSTDLPKTITEVTGKLMKPKDFILFLLVASTLFLGSCNHKPVSVLPAPVSQLSLQFDNWALGSDSISMVPNYQGINLWYSCNNDGGLSFYCNGFIQNGTTETGGPQPFTNGVSTDTVKLLVLDSTLYFRKNSYDFTYIYSAKKH